MQQSLDRAPHHGDATLAIVATTGDDENFRIGVHSRMLNLLLSQPRFAAGDSLSRGWQ
jgi:hypothetical protein